MAEMLLSKSASYGARPTIRVGGQSNPRLRELLIGMSMTENEGGLSALELRVSNVATTEDAVTRLAFEAEEILALGSSIAIFAGDEQAPKEIFRGAVTGLDADFPADGPPELVVLAEDALQQGRFLRRTATYDDISLSDLTGTIANRLHLQPKVTGFTEKIGTWVQLNESDLSFLRRLLQRYDGDLQIVGNELQVSPRGEVQRGSVELVLYGQLRAVRAIADLAHQVTKVTVSGWNPTEGRPINKSSTGAHLGPGSGRKGPDILSRSLGDRLEHVSNLIATTDAEAQALADAAFDQRTRRFVRIHGSAEGNPELRVGTNVRLRGVSRRFDNTYYVVSACHRYDEIAGYTTDFEAESAFLGEA